MTVAGLAPEVAADGEPGVAPGDELEHLVCCNPRLALCGVRLSVSEVVTGYWSPGGSLPGEVCPLCVLAFAVNSACPRCYE